MIKHIGLLFQIEIIIFMYFLLLVLDSSDVYMIGGRNVSLSLNGEL